MLYWQCCQYQALPDSGGVLDQEIKLLYTMSSLGNIYRIIEKYYSLGDRVNDALSVGERHTLKWLDDMGMIGGLSG